MKLPMGWRVTATVPLGAVGSARLDTAEPGLRLIVDLLDGARS